MADKVPFGVGGPAEETVDPSPMVGNFLQGLFGIPKHLIDAAANTTPGLRKEDVTDNPDAPEPNQPLINASTNAAASVMGLGGAAPAEENALRMGIKAYHASPHDFNAFDMSKMGTGEGTAAFGKGIYAAENPQVAKYYHDLSGPNAQTYHLDINAHPSHFLDWDKPLTIDKTMQLAQSPEHAQSIIDYLHNSGKAGKDLTGGDVYNAFSKSFSPEWATQQLTQAGIPGFKYLDAGSRLKGEGTSNYSVFDPSIISILKKEKGFNPPAPTPAGPGDAFRQDALKMRDDFYNKDVLPLQQQYMDTVRPQTLDQRRIARGYTTPAFKGGIAYFDKPMNPDFQAWQKETGGNGVEGNFYSTSDPKLADMYAGVQKDIHSHPDLPPYYSSGGNVMPLYLNTNKYHVVDAGNKNMTQVLERAKAEGWNSGAPGVTIKNVWDEPSFSQTLKDPQDVHITFPKGLSTVKSKFAKEFDPNSTNMLKGVGAVATPGVADMVAALNNKKDQKQ